MQGVMFFTLFLLFTLMGMETYRRVKNRDARFFRWLRKPQKLQQTPAAGRQSPWSGSESAPLCKFYPQR